MGNTIVLKPAPLTPLEAFVLADAAAAADLPPGVLNVITGAEDVGDALVTDPRVDLLSFTGSDAVGSTIMGRAAPGLKRVLLELGGKSALVVRHDADVPAAARATWSNVTHHAGQGCALLTRHLVHTSVHDEFVAHLIELAASTTVGDPADPATAMGPLISERQRARVESYIDAGRGDSTRSPSGADGRPACAAASSSSRRSSSASTTPARSPKRRSSGPSGRSPRSPMTTRPSPSPTSRATGSPARSTRPTPGRRSRWRRGCAPAASSSTAATSR